MKDNQMTNVPPQPYPPQPVQPGYPPAPAPVPVAPAPYPQPGVPGVPAVPIAPFPAPGQQPMPAAGDTVVNWAQLMQEAQQGGANFDPIPSGEYDVVVIEAEYKPTAKGKTSYKLKFRIMAGPHANRFIWDQLTVSPENANALAFFFKNVAALGCDSQFFATQPAPSAVAQNMMNRQVRIKVETGRLYQGSPQTDVKSYVSLGGAPTMGAVPQQPAGLVAPVQAAPAPQPPVAPPVAPPIAPPVAPAPQPQYPPQAPAPVAPPVAPAPAPVAPVAPVAPPVAPPPVAPQPAMAPQQPVAPVADPNAVGTPFMPAAPPQAPF